MENLTKIDELLASHGGMLTAKQVTEAGLHRSILTDLVNQNQLYRISRGVYMKPSAWEDEMFLLQHRYSKGVFSHETALYLHGISDRTPQAYTMTFPATYHCASLKSANVTIKRAIPENYNLGITEIASPCGNILKTYDLERTLCDVVRGNFICEIEIVNKAMKSYTSQKGKDIQKLMAYASQLRVKPKILTYMEILL